MDVEPRWSNEAQSGLCIAFLVLCIGIYVGGWLDRHIDWASLTRAMFGGYYGN